MQVRHWPIRHRHRATWRKAAVLLGLTLALLLTCRAGATEITAGPMIGAVSDSSARIWMQLNTAEDVSVWAVDVVTGKSTGSIGIPVTGPMPFVCDAALPNLEPDRDYRVHVAFEGQEVDLPGPPLIVHTMPLPGTAADFAVAFGSCANLDVSRDMPVFGAIADLHPQAMVFLGDAGYLPGKLAAWPATRKDAYRLICDLHHALRTLPDLQTLIRTTPCYAVWDDHDYGTNDADRTFVYSPEARVAWQVFWPNPSYGTAQAPGIYTQFTIGDAQFFLLDDRTYRDPDTDPQRKTMLGAGQLAWLKQELLASRATFKVIMNGSQVLADYSPFESWGHFEPERDDFIKWLFAHQVTGVLFASGDRHFGELTRRPADATDAASYPLYDLTSSPLANTIASAESLQQPNPQRVGPPVAQKNFGTFGFGGPAGHRFVRLRLCDTAGRVLLEKTVFAAELGSR